MKFDLTEQDVQNLNACIDTTLKQTGIQHIDVLFQLIQKLKYPLVDEPVPDPSIGIGLVTNHANEANS